VTNARSSAVESAVDDSMGSYTVSDSVVSEGASTDEEPLLTSVEAKMTVDLNGADIPDDAIQDWTRE